MRFLSELKVEELKNKRVILRVDYNVPVKNGEILDTKRIDASFETIDYLVKNGCKIILLSHFGRVKDENDLKNNSLEIVFNYIKSLNKYNIKFSHVIMGKPLDVMAENLAPGEIILVENTRYMDIRGKLESSCDTQLAMYWSNLGSLYIDDAFGSMHRNHASITGIPKYTEGVIGFLAEKEIKNLNKLLNVTERPFVVIMGGAKLDDKIELIYSLAEKADYLLLGGGIANTFLTAAGIETGSSLVSRDALFNAKSILNEFPDKIILPKDVIVSTTYNEQKVEVKNVEDLVMDDVIGDIGGKAVENYKRFIEKAKVIFINGTVGMYEKKEFSNGTREILDIVSKTNALKIVGGGDAASSVKKMGCSDKMDFISTGGGATLSYIANGTLPGIEAIINSKK